MSCRTSRFSCFLCKLNLSQATKILCDLSHTRIQIGPLVMHKAWPVASYSVLCFSVTCRTSGKYFSSLTCRKLQISFCFVWPVAHAVQFGFLCHKLDLSQAMKISCDLSHTWMQFAFVAWPVASYATFRVTCRTRGFSLASYAISLTCRKLSNVFFQSVTCRK